MASQPYLGAIFIFAGNFAPSGYQLCQGQLLAISQYAALFSILGTTYGGNGTTKVMLRLGQDWASAGRATAAMSRSAPTSPRSKSMRSSS